MKGGKFGKRKGKDGRGEKEKDLPTLKRKRGSGGRWKKGRIKKSNTHTGREGVHESY